MTKPLDAWTEVLETAIEAGGLQAARDFHPGDTIVDLLPDTRLSPAEAERHQPRQVAQHIPAGTELRIGEDGRVYGVGLEPPEERATIGGIPVETDEEIPEGVVELRHAETGIVYSRQRLATLATDAAAAGYVEKLVRRGSAVPFVNPVDADAEAPTRYMLHEWTPNLDARPITISDVVSPETIERVTGLTLEQLAASVAPPRPRSIYVASSWRNTLQPTVVTELRGAGFEVYDFRNPPGGTGFAWSEIDPDWEGWTAEEYVRLLDHPRAVEGFASDFDAMNDADTFVLVLPCGRSAHLELGWAVGAGKRTVILTRDGEEPELMAKMVDHIATSLDDVVEWLVDQPGRFLADPEVGARLDRILAEIDQVPIPSWDNLEPADPLGDLIAAAESVEAGQYDLEPDPLVAGVNALEEVAVAAAVDVDVESVELLRDAANALRSSEDGPAVIRNALATGLEHAARTLEAGNIVDDLEDVLEIATELAQAATLATCRVCGCTDEKSCDIPGRCAWEEPDLCTNPACLEADRS